MRKTKRWTQTSVLHASVFPLDGRESELADSTRLFPSSFFQKTPPAQLCQELRLGKVETSRARAQCGHEFGGVGDLGLDIVPHPVGIVAREDLAARHGGHLILGPHLLDVVVVIGVDNGRDVEEGHATKGTKVDLAEHAGVVLLALLDGVEVANVLVSKVDGGVLLVADSDGGHLGRAGAGSEVDGALDVIQSPEGDGAGLGGGGRGDEADDGVGEMHLDCFVTRSWW